jgi:hypothetical protein
MTQHIVVEYKDSRTPASTLLRLSTAKIEIPAYDLDLQGLRTLRSVLNHVLGETRFADKLTTEHLQSLMSRQIPASVATDGKGVDYVP